VQYTDGRQGHFDFAQNPGFKVGDAVKNAGNTLVLDGSRFFKPNIPLAFIGIALTAI